VSRAGTLEKVVTGRGFQERELRIPADLARLRDARDWAARVAVDFGLRGEDCFQVRLATSEAVTNAIVHGSGSGRDAVELGAHEEDGALVFEVRDGGLAEGVSPEAKALGEGGRGLDLVGMIMDEVELEQREYGSVLRFAKRPAA